MITATILRISEIFTHKEVTKMNENFFPSGYARADQAGFDAGLRLHMQRVFNYMGAGLGLTGLVAYAVAHSGLLATLLFSPLRFLVILAPIGIAMFMSFRMMSASASTLRTAFGLFCISMGVSMASIFAVYTGESIARVFFITAATFGASALWGYTTRSDLTGMGSALRMAVFGLIIAGLVNMFMMSPMVYWVSSVVSVLVFTGLTAYDAQKIKELYQEAWGSEANDKLAIAGALTLYMDFINMFISLLRLMGTLQQRNN